MIKGKIKAIRGDVLVHKMHFGETKTAGGIIIQSDDAKAHGVKPRWAQVYAKGHENNDPYDVGDWILIEHGRWTRKIKVQNEHNEEIELQKADAGKVSKAIEQITTEDEYSNPMTVQDHLATLKKIYKETAEPQEA